MATAPGFEISKIATAKIQGPYLESNLSHCYGVAKARIALRELPLMMILAPKKQQELNI